MCDIHTHTPATDKHIIPPKTHMPALSSVTQQHGVGVPHFKFEMGDWYYFYRYPKKYRYLPIQIPHLYFKCLQMFRPTRRVQATPTDATRRVYVCTVLHTWMTGYLGTESTSYHPRWLSCVALSGGVNMKTPLRILEKRLTTDVHHTFTPTTSKAEYTHTAKPFGSPHPDGNSYGRLTL